jgi:hypothetical protein
MQRGHLYGRLLERTGPGLLAEPVNAITNGSFLIAAWAAWELARRLRHQPTSVQVLLWLAVSVGIGSALWHTFATAATLILDIIPILVFLICFFWVYLRGVAQVPAPYAVAAIVAFVLATVGAQAFAGVLHGALYYTPALIFLLALGLFHARQRTAEPYLLLAASGVYLLALVLRTIDKEVCPAFPLGTHFLWHSLNGVAAYLAMRALIVSRASPVAVAQ